jgi:anthranilate/para-aminobenzoate synthase component I
MHVIEIDFCDPPAAAHALRDLPYLTFLDSAMADRKLGRSSFVAADPFARFEAREARNDWVSRLKSILAAHGTESLPGLPPFQGGAAGLFSYDLGRSLEHLPAPGDISRALTQHPEDYTLSLGHMGDLTIAGIGNDGGRKQRCGLAPIDAWQKASQPAGESVRVHELAHQLGFGHGR